MTMLNTASNTAHSTTKQRHVASSTTPQGSAYEALSRVLATERPIAFNSNLARLVGDAKAALLLSQLLYW
ncbi:hypothetical protein RZS08_62075, partial [Arthrospira platensis SPKY1]|nr:hypothetical protein [Arthrospira platensis SPKY1]